MNSRLAIKSLWASIKVALFAVFLEALLLLSFYKLSHGQEALDITCDPQIVGTGSVVVPYEAVCAPVELSGLQPPIAQPWFQHYDAAAFGYWLAFGSLLNQRATIQDLQAELQATQELLSICLSPPPVVCGEFSDKGGPRLWKPTSDTRRHAVVVLMPKSYFGETAFVSDKDGNLLSTTFEQTCCANGDRAHFWFDKTGSQLDPFKPVFLTIGNECWKIENPGDRIE